MSEINKLMDIIGDIEEVFKNCVKDEENKSGMYYLASRVDELEEIFIKLENDERRKYFDMIEEAMNGCYEPQTNKNRNDRLVEEYALSPSEKAQDWLDFWNNAIYYEDWGIDEPEFNDDVVSTGKYARYVLEPDEAIPYLMKKMDEVREYYESIRHLPYRNDGVAFEENLRKISIKSQDLLALKIKEIQEKRYEDNTIDNINDWNYSLRFLAYCLQKLGKEREECNYVLKKIQYKGKSVTKVQLKGAWNQVKNGWKEKGTNKEYGPGEDLRHLNKEKRRLSRLF